MIRAVGLNSSRANRSRARGASARTRALCSWSGPSRRVAASYSRPVKTSPPRRPAGRDPDQPDLVEGGVEAGEVLALERLQVAAGQRAGLAGDRDDPGRADEPSHERLPLLEQDRAAGRVDPGGRIEGEVQLDPVRLAVDRLVARQARCRREAAGRPPAREETWRQRAAEPLRRATTRPAGRSALCPGVLGDPRFDLP